MNDEALATDARHRMLDQLVGRWDVAMKTVSEQGEITRASGLVATKCWFAGGRYVREEIAGAFGGAQHEKLTLLGYNATRDRYEYMTADNHDGVILLYATNPGDPGDDGQLTLFADYAMPTENAGPALFVTIRTLLIMGGPHRHVLRNAYRPAGEPERSFLEYIYTRAG